MTKESLRKYLAEVIGTAVLVFMGCGSAVMLGCETTGGYLAVAFAFGLAVVAMAYAVGNISGCHLNPAVSLAAFMDKRISCRDVSFYIISQIVGGIVGAALLLAVSATAGTDMTGSLGSNLVAGAGGIFGAFLVEIILTFIFVFTILNVTADPGKSGAAGLVIGLTLTLVHIVGIALTGTSVNPARSIGPAVFAGGAALTDLWVFILAPFAGAALAALAYGYFKQKAAE